MTTEQLSEGKTLDKVLEELSIKYNIPVGEIFVDNGTIPRTEDGEPIRIYKRKNS